MADAPRIAYANELRVTIRQMLDTAELTDVMVSLDPLDIPSGQRHGIVVIAPPDLTFPSFHETEIAHELAIIAGPSDNLLHAWNRLDEIVEALRVGNLNMVSATGDMFALKTGSPLPGYAVILTPDSVLDQR